jgi:hypothetical protein
MLRRNTPSVKYWFAMSVKIPSKGRRKNPQSLFPNPYSPTLLLFYSPNLLFSNLQSPNLYSPNPNSLTLYSPIPNP